MTPNSNPLARALLPIVALLCCCVGGGPRLHAAETARKAFDLPADAAPASLKRFSEQSGVDVVFATRPATAVRTNAVKGTLTLREAMDRLLAGTGLVAQHDSATGAVTIVSSPNGPRAASPADDRPANRPGSAAAAPAETVRAAKPENPREAPVVQLSPFEVVAENDTGYQAGNTVSGSRLNSRLKDTPASVSAFTPEFLSDIAAASLEEMLQHATNIEVELEDSNAGFNNLAGRTAEGTDFQFRMRGSPAGAARDFVESSIPVDLYNVERAEVASGPNSILFGLGQAGGLVSLTGKKANLTRARTSVKSVFGSWNYERYEGDHNQVLIPRKLSLRLLGVYQNNEAWRHWDFNDQVRWSAAVAYQPFKHTVIHASYEKGHADNNLNLGWNAQDAVSGWTDRGRPVFGGTVAQPGTTRSNATNNRFIFVPGQGILYNARGLFETSNRYGVETLVSPEISPYPYSFIGPGGVRNQSFNSRQVSVQQRLPKGVSLDLAYFRNRNDVEANSILNAGANLRGDPNLTIPNPNGSATTVPNPNAGRLFFESLWFKDRLIVENELVRLSAAWEGGDSARWFGRHRVAGLLEHSSQDRWRRFRNEMIVDENNVPISAAGNAEANTNWLVRRHYITEGDYTTYYSSDPSTPMPEFTLNGRRYHSTYGSRGRQTNTHTIKKIDTFMLASQSFWFKDRLVTTLGARRDDITFKNQQEARVAADHPLVRAGQLVASEWYFTDAYATNVYQPTTFSAGAVLHATKRFSVFYNMSKNRGQPRFDRTVLPDGEVGPPTEGVGRDLGFMFDVLGDDRLFIRTTWFETKQLKDTPILPGGNTIGVDNLALMLGALQSAGKITQADYDRQAVDWSSGMIDVFTDGVEVEVVANPTRNLTLRASYSHSNRRRENLFPEIFAFFGARVPGWRQLLASNPAELATFNQAVADLDSELQVMVDRQNSPFGSRPHKLNGTARYAFREGRLKGAFVGGTVRYAGKNFLSQNAATGQVYWGNETFFADAFAGYRFRVPRTKLNATMQLNVKNLGNDYLAVIGRYNDTYTGVRRVYLNEPRSWRFSTSVEF